MAEPMSDDGRARSKVGRTESETTAFAEFAERLEHAERERDEALTQLARARAELDALRRALATKGEPEPPLYPDTAAPGLAPPLRYVVVDRINDALKVLAGPVQRRLRARVGTGRGR